MRTHGRVATRRWVDIELAVRAAQWSARVIREARRGAVVVAGPKGEVLRVDSVGLSGYGVDLSSTPFHILPEILRRTGLKWVESDLGDAPCAVERSPAQAAPSLGPGTRS